MSNSKQPSVGAVKLASEINQRAADVEDLLSEQVLRAVIDRHVAPLVEALEQIQAQRHNRYESTVAIVVAKAHAALKLWKDGVK